MTLETQLLNSKTHFSLSDATLHFK